MTIARFLMACGLALGLAACAVPDMPAGAVSKAAPFDYDVVAIKIDVPETLRVSEAQMLYPTADVVWRGDPPGNRYAQIKAIYEEAFRRGTADLHGHRDVIVEATVLRFHALTETARTYTGGVHSLRFMLTVRDAKTGEILDGPRRVVADVHASGGSQAIKEEAEGLTQKRVIEDRLAQVIHDELTAP